MADLKSDMMNVVQGTCWNVMKSEYAILGFSMSIVLKLSMQKDFNQHRYLFQKKKFTFIKYATQIILFYRHGLHNKNPKYNEMIDWFYLKPRFQSWEVQWGIKAN